MQSIYRMWNTLNRHVVDEIKQNQDVKIKKNKLKKNQEEIRSKQVFYSEHQGHTFGFEQREPVYLFNNCLFKSTLLISRKREKIARGPVRYEMGLCGLVRDLFELLTFSYQKSKRVRLFSRFIRFLPVSGLGFHHEPSSGALLIRLLLRLLLICVLRHRIRCGTSSESAQYFISSGVSSRNHKGVPAKPLLQTKKC